MKFPGELEGNGKSKVNGTDLDMANGKDRQQVRRAAKRWAISPEMKKKLANALEEALRLALESGSTRNITSVINTAAVLEAQDMNYEEQIDKRDRLDRSDPTQVIEHRDNTYEVEFDQRDDANGDV